MTRHLKRLLVAICLSVAVFSSCTSGSVPTSPASVLTSTRSATSDGTGDGAVVAVSGEITVSGVTGDPDDLPDASPLWTSPPIEQGVAGQVIGIPPCTIQRVNPCGIPDDYLQGQQVVLLKAGRTVGAAITDEAGQYA